MKGMTKRGKRAALPKAQTHVVGVLSLSFHPFYLALIVW